MVRNDVDGLSEICHNAAHKPFIRIEDHTILQETSKVARLTSRLSLGILCLIVLFSLYSNLRIINKEGDRLRFHPQQRLEEETEDQRVGKLRGLLPQANVMGYFSDQRPDKYHLSRRLRFAR